MKASFSSPNMELDSSTPSFTYYLPLTSFSHCLSFSPTPVIASHSPPLSVGVLLSNSILEATAAFPTICCTLPSLMVDCNRTCPEVNSLQLTLKIPILPVSVNPWNRWRTWELRFIQFPQTSFNASFTHYLSLTSSSHCLSFYLQHQSLPVTLILSLSAF
jgi:hypothetical protein